MAKKGPDVFLKKGNGGQGTLRPVQQISQCDNYVVLTRGDPKPEMSLDV